MKPKQNSRRLTVVPLGLVGCLVTSTGCWAQSVSPSWHSSWSSSSADILLSRRAQAVPTMSHGQSKTKNPRVERYPYASYVARFARGGGGPVASSKATTKAPVAKVAKTVATKKNTTTAPPVSGMSWFKPGASRREKWLAVWLLVWNSIALFDALLFTFAPRQQLDRYLEGNNYGPHALAQTRMLANCQLGLVLTVAMVALQGNERMIKNMFTILILCTLGAFRAVGRGVAEGTITPPWKEGMTFFMAGPPLLLLSYFAFVF